MDATDQEKLFGVIYMSETKKLCSEICPFRKICPVNPKTETVPFDCPNYDRYNDLSNEYERSENDED